MLKSKIFKFESVFLPSTFYTSTAKYISSHRRVSLSLISLIKSLLRQTLSQRRELLRKHFHTIETQFQFAKFSDSETTEEIQSFLEESVKDGCEGLMVKMLETDSSFYEPSRRSVNWLKVAFHIIPDPV